MRSLFGWCVALAGVVGAGIAVAQPLTLRDFGSFHFGGRTVVLEGLPTRMTQSPGGIPRLYDPNGRYVVEQAYTQYFLPQERRGAVPLLMWHGGGFTGVTYETTPDGRPGWVNHFVRFGWDTYNVDAVERGRAGHARVPEIWPEPPEYLTVEQPFELWRIGNGPGSYNREPRAAQVLPGSQFPVDAYEAFVRQIVPRWRHTGPATVAAYTALVDRVCPCVIMTHSQSGEFGFEVAMARPDMVRAIVALEPAVVTRATDIEKLARIPILHVYGDFIENFERFRSIRANHFAFYNRVRAAGGRVDVLHLPAAGLTGNSHFVMMDRNSDRVAQAIQDWLAGIPGLYR
jgi:pimeloyl-ACP methyl ester carboxylesterase